MKTFTTKNGLELPLLDMRGKDYLVVAQRIRWFRDECPVWSIETDFIQIGEKDALARAVIRTETGRIVATGHKYEDLKGFPDYREKAETGAIGRALALIGYGTQFCADELDEGQRLADSPVSRSPARVQQPGPQDGVPVHHGASMIMSGSYAKKTVGDLTLEELKHKKAILDEKPNCSVDELQTLEQVNSMIETMESMAPEAVPNCCGKEMMKSKFPNSKTGNFDWYCIKCRTSKART